MNAPNVEQFKQWAADNADLGHAVAMAQAFAQVQRERVDAYIKPIFEDFGFEYSQKTELRSGRTGRIPSPRDLYLCDDEAGLARFYECCDQEHRKHGFNGPHGHCPALVAENLLMEAERYLLEAGSKFFGVDFTMIFGEQRKQATDLLMGATIKAWSERKRRAA